VTAIAICERLVLGVGRLVLGSGRRSVAKSASKTSVPTRPAAISRFPCLFVQFFSRGGPSKKKKNCGNPANLRYPRCCCLTFELYQCAATCCSVLQYVAVFSSVLCCSTLRLNLLQMCFVALMRHI